MLKDKKNWIVDAVLFGAYILSMLLDLTGLEVHQWLGVFVTTLAGYHLLAHRRWVLAITRQFLGSISTRSRYVYLVNTGLMAGFLVTGVTGLVISSWLNLPLGDYLAWRDAHVIASVATLGLISLKIGLHWRWIVTVAVRSFYPIRANDCSSPAPRSLLVSTRYGRREFLGLMGIVGVAALSTSLNALSDIVSSTDLKPVVGETTPSAPSNEVARVQPSSRGTRRGRSSSRARVTSQSASNPPIASSREGSTISSSSTAPEASSRGDSATQKNYGATNQCVVQCPNRCSYPGKCRRYVDTNGNGLCDLGECA